jgi:predicted dehydrogenase
MNILVVGYGSIGKRHIKNLLTISNAKIIVYTKQKFSSPDKRIVVHNDLDMCLKMKPEIGFVTNETSYHIPIAMKLAKSGIDLFLEKPLSHSVKNIHTLENTVQKNKLITQMGCHLRFHPCLKKIKQLIDKKFLGKIISVQVENGSYLPDWHPYEDYRKGYAAKDDLGGGVTLTCIHEIDYLYWFFGELLEISSITGKFSDLELTTDDYSTSIMKFKNGVIGELHLDYFQRPEYRQCKIRGTKGILYWNSDDNEVKFFSAKQNNWKTILKLNNFERNNMYVDEIKYFLKCVKQRQITLNDVSQGIKTLEIALSIKKSSKTKRFVSFS